MRAGNAYCDPSIQSGRVYGVGLAWPPPQTLPPDEAAITSLAVSDNGEVWGATSGKQAHLFWMPGTLQASDVGPIPGTQNVADGLVIDTNGILYGAGRDVGGQLFSCDTQAGVLTIYINVPDEIRSYGPVFEDDRVACLTISQDGKTLAGVADQSGRLFVHEIETGERVVVEPPEESGCARVLTAAADGYFYGALADGELYRLSADGEVARLGIRPAGGGEDGDEVSPTALICAANGGLLAGTGSGHLLRYRVQAGECVDHGRACPIPRLHSLVELRDGRVFGAVGGEEDLAHLVCYSPETDQWQDLGMLECHGHFPWTAHEIGPLAVGPTGEIFAGEKGRFGHLFIYHPE